MSTPDAPAPAGRPSDGNAADGSGSDGSGSDGSGSDSLVAPEGVDEGSAAQTADGARPATAPAASPGTDLDAPDDLDVVGAPPSGGPVRGEQDAGPVDMESEESRAARAERAPGQQYATGEG